MRSTKAFFAVLLMTLLMIGCGDLTVNPSDPTKPSKPAVETVWTVIADYVDSGDITDSTKLELMVKKLRSHGDIDDSAVEKFYKAFDCKTKEISISKDDSAKLRSL